MSGTSVSTNKTSTNMNTTGKIWSCTTTEKDGYKLFAPPENLTSGLWKNFQIIRSKNTNKFHIENCRHCGKEVKYKNGSTWLKTHALNHKNKIEINRVQLQSDRNKCKRKFQKKMVPQIRSRLKIKSKTF